MNAAILGLLAETPVHPGIGRSMGVVDLPVAREAVTDYPVIVGSSLKGALRSKAERINRVNVEQCFGGPARAGDLLVSDGRLLLLPVRSLTTSFRWVTCPHIIERYDRDLARAGFGRQLDVPGVQAGSVLADEGKGSLFLEERQFSIVDKPPSNFINSVSSLILHGSTSNRLAAQVVVLNDDDFGWFARYGLSIQARNVLEDGTKRSENLWYEETLPPDTVMYALVLGRTATKDEGSGKAPDPLDCLREIFAGDPYLQVGGNETVGQGWLAVRIQPGGAL